MKKRSKLKRKTVECSGYFPTPPGCDRIHAVFRGTNVTDLSVCRFHCDRRITCVPYMEHERILKLRNKSKKS